MAFGLDYSVGMPPIDTMKAARVEFVCRYIGYSSLADQTKILTPQEALTLSHAGIALVSNWEWYVKRVLEGFAAGVWDAQEAQRRHANCGGPPKRPIYFSADEDYSAAQVIDYFHGVASVIGLARTGAYGSYRLIAGLFDAGAIAWGWQTYAWSGGQWEPRAHIQQYNNGVIMSGLSVDYDRSIKSDFGQWTQGGTMVPQGWTDANSVLTAPNGVHVVHGFRDYVLAHNWDGANYPLAAEFATGQLEASNTSLGAGSQQIFRWSMLGYTPAHGVFFEWLGQELAFCRQQVQKYAAQIQLDNAQIAQLKADLAAAQAQQPTGVDAAKVADRLSAFGLLGKQVEQLAAQPIS